MEIKNKVVIITGASHGIGEAAAKLLSAKGAKVVLAARSREKIDTVQKELPGSLAITTDMRKPEDIKNLIKKTIEKFGRVDILINNASAIFLAHTLDTPMKRYDLINSVNARGTFFSGFSTSA